MARAASLPVRVPVRRTTYRVRRSRLAYGPALAELLGWIVLGEAMTVRKAAAMLLIVSGVVLLTAER